MKILILMSDTGGGHRSPAEAIAAAVKQLDNDATIELLDFFATCAPFPLKYAGSIYGPWIKYASPVWGASFHLTNGRLRAELLGTVISCVTRQCVEAKLHSFQPDVLVCVHPLATRLASAVRQRAGRVLPLANVVTDLVTAHAAWFTRDVDVLMVPSEAVRARAVQAGIPQYKVRVTGLPVHPRFTGIAGDRATTRESLGLARNRFTVLLLGGGEGMGRVAEMAQAMDRADLPLQQIVVCGRNQSLQRQLESLNWHAPTRILGFVRTMPALMHAADVVATKAGTSTICEALVVGRPILFTGSLPGQEQGNVEFVVKAGAGRLTEAPQALIAALRDLACSNGEVKERMAAGAQRLSKPSAAGDIAHLLFSLREAKNDRY